MTVIFIISLVALKLIREGVYEMPPYVFRHNALGFDSTIIKCNVSKQQALFVSFVDSNSTVSGTIVPCLAGGGLDPL